VADKDPIEGLVALLGRLPGVGERTAQRLAYFVLGATPDYAKALGKALAELHDRVRRCERCGNWGTERLCTICSDARRDRSLVCVVARPPDVAAMERGGGYRGVYYVLHALLAPLEGIGPSALTLEGLLGQAKSGEAHEVILATPLSVEGEATALYLGELLQDAGIAVSRIASGVPHGGDLELTDQVTLTRALEGRRKL
jgi:recombination protein RecR